MEDKSPSQNFNSVQNFLQLTYEKYALPLLQPYHCLANSIYYLTYN